MNSIVRIALNKWGMTEYVPVPSILTDWTCTSQFDRFLLEAALVGEIVKCEASAGKTKVWLSWQDFPEKRMMFALAEDEAIYDRWTLWSALSGICCSGRDAWIVPTTAGMTVLYGSESFRAILIDSPISSRFVRV